jgi:hypothetical protein
MATPFFSNQPLFCTKPGTVAELFTIEQFNALTAANLACSAQNNACLDPNLGTTFVKNVVNKVIRCGGRPIDINFFMSMFPEKYEAVGSKRIFNHYICDPELNIFAAASVTGASPGAAATFQVLKQNHSAGGSESLAAEQYTLVDKDNRIMYNIDSVDTTVPYAHKVTITPWDSDVTVSIKANTAYLIIQSSMVGGCSCPNITNKTNSIGYSREVKPLRVRSDWKVCIDLLRGYQDKIQYAVIYDVNGQPYDSWDVFEAAEARMGVRMALNVLSFIGSPITNTSLITGGGAIVDQQHTGFYGLIPTIENGGGIVQNYNSAVGFDLEADGEPIFLYQDSLKRSNKFLFLSGQKFLFNLDNRANKMVARTDVGKNVFEAYKRMGDYLTPEEIHGGKSYLSEVAKFGIKSYDYRGFELDFKKWDALSDVRYMGSDYYSNLVVGIPMDGPTQNGQPISPIEFYQYGMNGWTGGYEEIKIDYRYVDGCENIGGYSAQSIMMGVHCPQLFILLKPAKAA